MSTTVPASPTSNALPVSRPAIPIATCALTGLLGGFALMAVTHVGIVSGAITGTLFGALFAIVFANRAIDRGSGLLWGLSYALLLWLAVVPGAQVIAANLSSSFQTQRDNFPDLVGFMLCFGTPLGLMLGTLGGHRNRATLASISLPRAIIGGGFA